MANMSAAQVSVQGVVPAVQPVCQPIGQRVGQQDLLHKKLQLGTAARGSRVIKIC